MRGTSQNSNGKEMRGTEGVEKKNNLNNQNNGVFKYFLIGL